MKQAFAFSLVELLVVVFILAVLSTIAYPSYQQFVVKTRRAEAQSELTKAQVTQSSYHILNPSYLLDAESLGLPLNHDFYRFSVVSVSTHTYLMKAEAKSATSQSNDEISCQTLYIDQDNNKTRDGVLDNSECWQD